LHFLVSSGRLWSANNYASFGRTWGLPFESKLLNKDHMKIVNDVWAREYVIIPGLNFMGLSFCALHDFV
jgi:hypothetical protein